MAQALQGKVTVVTGASGFVGAELVKQLLAAGATVRATVRGKSQHLRHSNTTVARITFARTQARQTQHTRQPGVQAMSVMAPQGCQHAPQIAARASRDLITHACR